MTLQFNPAYLDTRVLAQLKTQFAEKQHLLLNQFAKMPLPKTWKRSYVPDAHSYEQASLKPPAALIQYVQTVTQQPLKLVRSELQRFSNRDYTVIKDGKADDVIEVILCLSPWDVAWGGKIVYKTDTNATVINPQENSLSIVRTGAKKRFIQYVNHYAKHALVLAVLTFQRNKR